MQAQLGRDKMLMNVLVYAEASDETDFQGRRRRSRRGKPDVIGGYLVQNLIVNYLVLTLEQSGTNL